jgi:steroid delta-isomerase-like uncharacterized protein
MSARHDLGSVARSLYAHFNARALERAAELITADHDWSIAATTPFLREPSSYRAAMSGWIAAFSDIAVEVTNVITAGDSVAVEYIVRGTNDGPIDSVQGMMAPTRRRLTLPITDIHQFTDGRLRRTRTYYDGASLLAQLGVDAGATIEEQNKAAMRRVYEIFNAGRLEDIEGVMAAELVSHEAFPGIPSGRGGFRLYVKMIRNAFPDLRMDVQQLVADGDTVVARVRMTGTHRAHFLDIPATGRRVDITLVDIARFENGVGVEHWGYTDTAALMQQLGIAATPHGMFSPASGAENQNLLIGGVPSR